MKQNIDFKYLREHGLVLYEYIRGSQLHGLARPESDEDHGGVYIEPLESLLGVSKFPEDVHNETNDDSWFSLGKYMQLLLNSNPNILESLYVPEDKIIYKHPIMDYILENRDKFITKKCFGSFMGYAKTQMERARNLKKKIVMPIEGPMQSCLEFIMFSEDGGSKPVTTWLSRNGLEQKYCGLVNLDKMICMYCMYYDWGAHIYNVLGINTYEEFEKFVDNHWNSEGCTDPFLDTFFRYVGNSCGDFYYYENFGEVYELNYNSGTLKRIWDKYNKPFGYHGLVSENDCSYQVRLSSIPKGEKPVLTVSYNKDGYSAYCRQYTEYHDWKKHHNEERFNLAKKGQYDCYLDSETVFLTEQGWKKFDDLLEDDKVACFDGDRNIYYSPILSKTDKIYDGYLFTYETRYTKFTVSMNHNLYLSPCHRTPSNNFSYKYDPNRSDWQLIPVIEFYKNKRGFYNIIQNLKNDKPDNVKYSDDFIKLLGYFLSEGTWQKDKKGKKICARISQLESGDITPTMRSITSIPIKEYSFTRKGRVELTWDIKDKFVLEKFNECGGDYAKNKTIPEFVNSFSKRQFKLLLDSMIEGDGYVHKKGHSIYYTQSKDMAVRLHTLLTLNGFNSQLYGKEDNYRYKANFNRKDGQIFPVYQIFISQFDQSYGLLNKKDREEAESSKRGVEGHSGWSVRMAMGERIVCVETEKGTVVTMNDYKLAFQGNCKNMTHSARLFNMGIEIARGEGVKIDRSNIDRDWLMSIRQGEIHYDDLMAWLKSKDTEMKDAMANSTIPDEINIDFVDELLIKIRKEFYKL